MIFFQVFTLMILGVIGISTFIFVAAVPAVALFFVPSPIPEIIGLAFACWCFEKAVDWHGHNRNSALVRLLDWCVR